MKAQHRDPECMAILQQLKVLKEGGMPALKIAGVSKERMRYLQLHEVDAAGQLRCAEVIVHVYGKRQLAWTGQVIAEGRHCIASKLSTKDPLDDFNEAGSNSEHE